MSSAPGNDFPGPAVARSDKEHIETWSNCSIYLMFLVTIGTSKNFNFKRMFFTSGVLIVRVNGNM